MRFIDEEIGTVICVLLSIFLKLKRVLLPSGSKKNIEDVRTILCQKYLGMGSILNSIPLIKALRKKYPGVKIIFMTLEAQRDVVELCGIADEIITVRLDSLPVFIWDTLRAVKCISSREIDISIDLEFFSKFTLIVSSLASAGIRIGLHQRKIRPQGLLTHQIFYNPYKHLSKIYFAYASALGIKYDSEYFQELLPVPAAGIRERLRGRFNLSPGKKIVIINANSSELFKFRSWPAEYFAELIRSLSKKHPNNQYVLIGNEGDADQVNHINDLAGRPDNLINAMGKTDLEELFALIEMSELVITNDSGPMHIASFYGKNTVVFFGPESPFVYGPVNANSVVFYSKDIYCSPCLNVYDSKKSLYGEECKKNLCLINITPEEVFDRIEKVFIQ